MPTVKVSMDNLAEDAVVEIPYLGYFTNNTTTEVEQERWDRFVRSSPVGATYADKDTYEVSTESQKADAEGYALRAETAGSTASELEDDHKKDELVSLAQSMNIDTTGKNKDELARDIANAQGNAGEQGSFSSVAEELENDQEE